MFTYGGAAGLGLAHDDIAIDNVVVTSTRTTTTSVTSLDGNYNWTASYTRTVCLYPSLTPTTLSSTPTVPTWASATVTLTNAQAGDRFWSTVGCGERHSQRHFPLHNLGNDGHTVGFGDESQLRGSHSRHPVR